MSLRRRRSRWGVAMLAAILPAVVGGAIPAAAAGLPVIVTGERHGPVAVHGADTYADVLSIALPAGRWAVAAKLGLSNLALASRTVVCRLQAESGFDQTRAHLGSQGNATARSTPTLLMAHVYASNGTAQLKCRANGTTGDVAAHDIAIQAIRAGTLQQVSMGDDTSHSTGTNDPVIVHGRLDPTVALPSSGEANLPLAAGRWAVTAKAYVTTAGAVQPVVDCTLEGPAEVDRTSVHPNQEASPGESVPVALAGMVDLAGAGSVVFDCSSDLASAGTGEGQMRYVRITALRVGTYAYDELGGADPTPVGDGKPIAIGGFRAGPLDVSGNDTYASVGSLHVGKGSWVVTAKVALQSSVGGGYARCQLVAGADKDASLGSIDPGGDNDRRSAAMLLTHVFAEESGGTLDVRCSSNSPTGAIQARSVRIVAVKAGTLTTGS